MNRYKRQKGRTTSVLNKIWESKEAIKHYPSSGNRAPQPDDQKRKKIKSTQILFVIVTEKLFSSYLERYSWRSWGKRPWWEERRHRTRRSSWTSWYSGTGWVTRASRSSRISWQTCESSSSTLFQIAFI